MAEEGSVPVQRGLTKSGYQHADILIDALMDVQLRLHPYQVFEMIG